jgi:uncharacterized protein YdeI (YjbR/CyaY-like superfamily)
MSKHNPAVDVYIAKSGEFAKPILTRLRSIVHAACPEVEETIKWSAPNFAYKGMLCGMAAFKAHCRFVFWKSKLISQATGKEGAAALEVCEHLAGVADLPSKKMLTACIKAAMTLNEGGAKVARPKKQTKDLVIPAYFKAALKKSKKAQATFEAFSPSHKREYVEWLTDAKTEDTRLRRLQTAIEWLAEGKPRNWKYMNC